MIRKTGTFDSLFNKLSEEQGQGSDQLKIFPTFSWKEVKPFGQESQSQDFLNWNNIVLPIEQRVHSIAESQAVAPKKPKKEIEPQKKLPEGNRVPIDPSIKPKSMKISKKNRRLKSCPEFRTGNLRNFKGGNRKRQAVLFYPQGFVESAAHSVSEIRLYKRAKATL